jgi:hypothetical protein
MGTNPLLQATQLKYYEIELPSKGFPYILNGTINDIFEEGAIVDGKIKIKELTTKEELIWTDRELVESLQAPIIIAESIVKGLKSGELLAQPDLEYILLESRKVSYGDYVEINWTCDHCGHNNSEYVKFDTIPIKKLNSVDDLILTINNYKITMIPLITKEAIEILQANEETEDNIEEQLDRIISCIMEVEVKINDEVIPVRDKAMIAEWIENLNPKLFQKIMEHFTKINEIGKPDLMNVKCKECGHKSKANIIVDVTSFLSKEELAQRKKKS